MGSISKNINKESTIWNIYQSVFMVCAFYAINFPLWDVLVAQAISPEWASFLVYSLLFVLCLGLYHQHIRLAWQKFRQENPNGFKVFLKLSLILILSWGMINLLVVGCQQIFSLNILPENTENIKENATKMPQVLTFIMLTIYAPIIEELTFRQAIIGWVPQNNKFLLGGFTLLSILMFDMIHVIHLQEFIYYLPLTLALTYVYLKFDRNVIDSMLFHALANGIAFILILMGGI